MLIQKIKNKEEDRLVIVFATFLEPTTGLIPLDSTRILETNFSRLVEKLIFQKIFPQLKFQQPSRKCKRPSVTSKSNSVDHVGPKS